MTHTDEYGRTWRFHVNSHDGTVTRGRLYQLPENSDLWESYFDDSEIVGFFEEGFRGRRLLDTAATEDSQRAMDAYRLAEQYGADPHEALRRVAQRITGYWDARFIVVGMYRGTDLFVLSWDGDPMGHWRDEIEAVNECDVWRIECEELVETGDQRLAGYRSWQPADEVPEQYYGEDKGIAGWEREFPLAEFPAERFVGESVGA